jgi:hypothetical protein
MSGAFFSSTKQEASAIHWELGSPALGPQNEKKGKGPRRCLKFATGFVDDVENFGAIASVMWLGRCTPLHRSRLIEPPEHLRGFKAFVESLTGEQRTGLLPETNLLSVAVVPAVADDAVLFRHQSRQHRGLRCAGDCRERATERRCFTELCDLRCILQKPGCETYDVDDAEFGHSDNAAGPLSGRRFQFTALVFGPILIEFSFDHATQQEHA